MPEKDAPGKEVTGKKMAVFVVGLIIVVSILIVIAIQFFYAVWDPKPAKEIEVEETTIEMPLVESSAITILRN